MRRLALALIKSVSSGWTGFIAEDLARAETLALKALALDSAIDWRVPPARRGTTRRRRHFDLRSGRSIVRSRSTRAMLDSYSQRGEHADVGGQSRRGSPLA